MLRLMLAITTATYTAKEHFSYLKNNHSQFLLNLTSPKYDVYQVSISSLRIYY